MSGFYYNHSTDGIIRINVAYKNQGASSDEFSALKKEYELVCEQYKDNYPLIDNLSFEKYEDTLVIVVRNKDYKDHLDLVASLLALQLAARNSNIKLSESIINFHSDPVVGIIRLGSNDYTIEVHTIIFNQSGFFSNEIYTIDTLSVAGELYQ